MPTRVHDGERLLIVGIPLENHVGGHLCSAAAQLGIDVELLDSRQAWSTSRIVNRLSSSFRDNKPAHMAAFQKTLIATAGRFRPRWVLVAGLCAVSAETLGQLALQGATPLLYSTDNPWNPNFEARWLSAALPHYARVFTPRSVNLESLAEIGCKHVAYLPFGYNPEVHRPASEDELAGSSFSADAVFIGAADSDRVPFMNALIGTGLDVSLFGLGWERYRSTRSHARGAIDAREMRVVLARSKLSVCLVRRRNHDSHVMRTYEEPAAGACMIFERTDDHIRLFGAELSRTASFENPHELAALATRFCADADERARVRSALTAAVTTGHNTWRDRLATMLALPDDTRCA